MPNDIDDDAYVANLLKEDAKNAKKKYELVGIDAFNPRRDGAPKPNTSFLRHIIRQTDSHNAALLAKEAEESNARLKQMNKKRSRAHEKAELWKERKAEGRLTPVLSDVDSQRRTTKRRAEASDSEEHHNRRRRRDHSLESDVKDRDRLREKRRTEDSEKGQSLRRSKHRHHKDEPKESGSDDEYRSRKKEREHRRRDGHRSHRHSKSRSRSRSPHRSRHHKSHRHQDRSRSPRRKSRERNPKKSCNEHDSSKSKRPSSPTYDSDPLEAILGPLPAPKEPALRSRGRGAHKANTTGIDTRFSSNYDPSIDVRANSDTEDHWGDAVEAFRDRQKWKQTGAERLKAAGFTDAQVKKWENGDEKSEEDVVWAKRGQAREWDRGKVVDGEGDVDVKAEWGRLT